ncbi:MAG: hypothetical protein HY756_12535 [Nitrospirae bacterium]|nr:hypothetical protein [Nitrospirota bacterium]
MGNLAVKNYSPLSRGGRGVYSPLWQRGARGDFHNVIPVKTGIQRKGILQYAPTIFCMVMLFVLTFIPFAHADTPDTNIINIYDSNGNLVTGDGNYYEYNDANQLVRVRQGDQTGAVVAEYFYDYSGQRIKKIENGVTTYYIGKHFEKQVGGTGEGNSSYYFAEGERVAKKDPSGNIYFYHSDHLGGTNAVTDSAGTVVARADYLPFGEMKQGSTGNEKYSYTGKEKDKTDLYYFEARYNSPMFKHFTQADVASPDLSDPQDLNRYSYVGNNPMSYVDPDGFKKKKKANKVVKKAKQLVSSAEKTINKNIAVAKKITGKAITTAVVLYVTAKKPELGKKISGLFKFTGLLSNGWKINDSAKKTDKAFDKHYKDIVKKIDSNEPVDVLDTRPQWFFGKGREDISKHADGVIQSGVGMIGY